MQAQQQQAALVAQLQQQQLARGLAPLTPQQLAHLVHLRQQQQQQQQPQQPPVQAHGPAGITSTERPLRDGDHDHRSALGSPAAAPPTDRSLPVRFKPTAAAAKGPSDERLAPSLESLQLLADAYTRLQHIERRADWTLARTAHELAELATAPPGKGQPFKRTLRLHVVATLHDQSWQLSPDQLAAQAEPASTSSTPLTPRVELAISGQVLD
ncbi:hypothetical protein JCM3774_004086, partial [Rhodotorula dairenensis]